MATFGNNRLIAKIPNAGDLRNPITLGRVSASPDASVGFDYTITPYRHCYAKVEIDLINTSGTDDDFLQELTHNFLIRKAPNVKIEPKIDRVIYGDKVLIIQNVLDVNHGRERYYQVIQCSEERDVSNIDFTKLELDEESAKEEDDNTGFFGEWS